MATRRPEPEPGTVTADYATGFAPDEAAVAVPTASADLMAGSMREYAQIWVKRIRSGESGALPVIVGLVAIVIFFQVKSSLFLSAGNLVNLLTQAAFIITLGMAEIFVLLLGEIDLAAGYTMACAAVIALWMMAAGQPWWLAVIAALAFGAVYGTLQGLVITWLRLPSFVVSLAGLLGLSGLVLFLLSSAGRYALGGVIGLSNNIVSDVDSPSGDLTPAASWIVMIVLVVLAGGLTFLRDRRRRVAGLVTAPASITLLKVAAMAVAGVVIVLVANTNRASSGLVVLHGLPWVVLVVLAVVAIYTVLLGRTRFGRYVYAIGGNAEAARRAGINTMRIRTLAFMLCGLTAGATGIIYASYLGSISSDVNGGQYVLYGVAAAVIGGTSLFGGRGKMMDAVLGGLVIGVIYNGLELIGLGADGQLIWTAVVLLAAVILDSLTRRGQRAR